MPLFTSTVCQGERHRDFARLLNVAGGVHEVEQVLLVRAEDQGRDAGLERAAYAYPHSILTQSELCPNFWQPLKD